MTLIIYHDDDTAFETLREFQFNSEFMGDSKITGVIYSPDKINFAVNDYVMFKGNKYYMPLKPIPTKTALTGKNIGDAIKYNLIFQAEYNKLKNINFEDYVSTDDSNVYYTGTSNFSFYNNINELALRIQANLDRFFGDGIWTVNVASGLELEEKQVSANNIYVWDALLMVNNVFNLNFFISGNNITIGGAGNEISQIFYYGKNKGLYEITRSYNTSEKIITRLKVYGSSRNIPPNYLRDEDSKGRYFTKLMLPNFAITGIDYVDAPSEIINEYGIIEGVMEYDDIYPSIEEINLGSGRIDEIISVDTIEEGSDYFTINVRDLGFNINDYLTAETPLISIKGTNADGSSTYLGGYEFEIVEVTSNVTGYAIQLLKNQTEVSILPDTITTVRAGDRFVILGISMPQVYITNAENKLYNRASSYFDNQSGLDVSYNVSIDEKFIEDNDLSDIFVTGDKIKIEDNDLEVSSFITIQNVTIKYEENKILPEYEIKLSDLKSKTLKEDFKNTISNQGTINTFTNNSITSTRISNNLKVDQIGEDLTWQ